MVLLPTSVPAVRLLSPNVPAVQVQSLVVALLASYLLWRRGLADSAAHNGGAPCNA
jgi:hypothetical protein